MATTYVRSLATGHKRISIMTAPPSNPEAATLAELNAGIGAACRIAASSKLGASDDNTVNDPALCDTVAADVPTTSKYDGQFDIFRYFDPATKNPETGVGDAVFQAMRKRGTTLYIAVRETLKESTEEWAATDPYQLYEVVTGTPQDVESDGFIKKSVKLYVQQAWEDGVVAAA